MRLLAFLIVAVTFSSCNINSYIMLKETKNTVYTEPPVNDHEEYKIAPYDQISFRFYRNNGFDILGIGTGSAGLGSSDAYNVEQNGEVKLPFLGKIKISGYTIRQAETYLENLYDTIFVDPFILLTVSNRRLIVSRGNGLSQMVNITNNMSVIEAITSAGGIDQRGKTKSIKLIRRVTGGHEIYKLDLSTLDGLAMAEMQVQSNDIIYVDPRKNYVVEILRDVAPYLSIISSAFLIYQTTRLLTK